ncbi:MAG: phenylalanine--tRNA ligase subunit alpha [Kiritimatiellae bacterium]|nr:phenylalanine--tRNA ligase subunit alpha [Kiritimatiellia bacterium]MCO5061034.1 phenylalanine--tRNA ligase subunit alpha [Kiritimatiellia bacterium]MCO6400044.1 phenylalanine--tRNA ligase subunit alpha [Verrucomicrobiota bacterium]
MNNAEIQELQAAAIQEVGAAPDAASLESARVKYLGRNGRVQDVLLALRQAPVEQKRELGRLANEFKTSVQAAVDARKDALQASASVASFDVTLPGRWHGLGTRHPVTQIIDRAVEIFGQLGFTVADGPDIETTFHNFDALNTPANHPSRDPKDTFYLDDTHLLRTHTSPVQIRVMQSRKPPVRIIAPGRCYRRDTTDATHSANFHQVEGLYVDRKVSLADLKGDLTYFARQMMGPDVKIRFRPHFFPFTEPSVEYDFSCHVCHGAGCRVCKHSGWIEISGAGMVDPHVFKAVGYDSSEVTGYAFGMGVERIAMILLGVPDIRMLYDNDVRFLGQF